MANILIVEDDTDLREGLSFSFSSDGHNVEETETKKGGLQKIAIWCGIKKVDSLFSRIS